MPDSTEMPAPVMATAFGLFLRSAARSWGVMVFMGVPALNGQPGAAVPTPISEGGYPYTSHVTARDFSRSCRLFLMSRQPSQISAARENQPQKRTMRGIITTPPPNPTRPPKAPASKPMRIVMTEEKCKVQG